MATLDLSERYWKIILGCLNASMGGDNLGGMKVDGQWVTQHEWNYIYVNVIAAMKADLTRIKEENTINRTVIEFEDPDAAARYIERRYTPKIPFTGKERRKR